MEYNLETFQSMVKDLEKEHLNKMNDLAIQFAMANNALSKGDIATDHIGSILIEKISTVQPSYGRLPDCFYYGLELKKDGTPMKKLSRRGVYQSNLKTK